MSERGRQRLRAWGLFLAGIAFIIATLELASEASQFLRSRGYMWQTVKLLSLVASGTVLYLLWVGARIRSPWVYLRTLPALAVFVYTMLTERSNPAERFHFVEYGALYLIALHALVIDLKGVRVYVLAFALTALAGWFDEQVQGWMPTRIYDAEDVEMNVIAAALAGLVFFSLFGLDPTRARFASLPDPIDDGSLR